MTFNSEKSAVAGAPGRSLWQKGLDALSGLGISAKINALLIGIGLLPPLAGLLLLHQTDVERFQSALALYIAAVVVLYYPFAKAMEELIVLRQARRINAYVDEVKAGRRSPNFDLPNEKGNEHDFLRFAAQYFLDGAGPEGP
jgi:hypothetical protein